MSGGKISSWTKVKIGDACRVGDGAHGSLKRYDNGIMYLTSKNFKSDGLDLSKLDYIDEKTYQKYFKENSTALTRPIADDVLFSIIGSIGSPYLVQPHDLFGISSSVAILRPDTSFIFPKYLFYWIKGQTYQDALNGIKGGVAQGYVSLEMIRSLPLYYPSLPTQRKIADVLSAYDDLIEVNTRRIRVLEAMAQSVYREWFGNVDAKSLPRGWRNINLFEIAEVTYGNPFKSKLFTTEPVGMPVIRIRDISKNFSDTYTSEETDEKYIVKNGDILVGMDGDFHMGKWAWKDAYLNQRVVRFRPKENISRYFLFLALQRPIHFFDNTIVGTTVAHLGDSHLRTIDISVPDEKLIEKINNILEPIYELEISLRLKNANLRRTRDLLLPRLVSGEVVIG